MPIDNVALAGPITYSVEGLQYIAVNAGRPGSPVNGLTKIRGGFRTPQSRLLVFKLGRAGKLRRGLSSAGSTGVPKPTSQGRSKPSLRLNPKAIRGTKAAWPIGGVCC